MRRERGFQFATDARQLSKRTEERRRQLEEERQRECTFKPSIPQVRYHAQRLFLCGRINVARQLPALSHAIPVHSKRVT